MAHPSAVDIFGCSGFLFRDFSNQQKTYRSGALQFFRYSAPSAATLGKTSRRSQCSRSVVIDRFPYFASLLDTETMTRDVNTLSSPALQQARRPQPAWQTSPHLSRRSAALLANCRWIA